MIMGIESLVETFKQFLQTLQISFLFPAATLTGLSLLLYPGNITRLDDSSLLVFVTVITIVLSNMFFAFNGLIIRFIEGYEYKNSWYLYLTTSWFFVLSKWRGKKRYKKLIDKIDTCKQKIEKIENFIERYTAIENSKEFNFSENFRCIVNNNRENLKKIHSAAKHKLDQLEIERRLWFPSSEEQLLPTAFGNTLLAFEQYPWERYKMDAVALYPRLLPILKKKEYLPFLQTQKTTLDFLLNTCIVSTILGVEQLIWFTIYSSGGIFYFILAFIFLFLTLILYQSAIFVAKDWGVMVCAAFDLYRNDLRLSLNLKNIPDESIEEERKLWASVSNFINLARTDDNFTGFVYSRISKDQN